MARVAVGVAVPNPGSEPPRRSNGVPAESRLLLGDLNVAYVGLIDRPKHAASPARTAITRTLVKGCRRLILERGSSKVAKDAKISSSLLRVLAITDLRLRGPIHDTVDGIQGRGRARKPARFTGSS